MTRRARGPGRVDHRPGRLHAGAGGCRRAPRRRAAHRLSGRGAWSEAATGITLPARGGEPAARPSWSSTAPGLAPARLAGSPATTTPSTSTRARASSWSSTRRTARRSSGSCSPSPARARRACSCSRPSTARWSPGRPRSTRRTPRTGRSVPAPATRSCRRRPPSTRPSPAPSRSSSYAGLRPAGRGVNYLIAAVRRLSRARQRGRDPLHRPHGVAGDRRARLRDRRRARRRRSATRAPLEPGSPARAAGPWWRRTADHRAAAGPAGGG